MIHSNYLITAARTLHIFLFFPHYSTKMGEFVVSAGTAEKRMYWLQQLQKARREFSAGGAAAFKNSGNPHQVSKI